MDDSQPSEPTFSLTKSPKSRILGILSDMERRLDWAAEIVSEGEDRFGSEDNWRTREAMKSILVDLDTAARRIPVETRKKFPVIPWRKLTGLRDILSHDYSSIRYGTVWNTAAKDLPELRKELESMRSEMEGTPSAKPHQDGT